MMMIVPDGRVAERLRPSAYLRVFPLPAAATEPVSRAEPGAIKVAGPTASESLPGFRAGDRGNYRRLLRSSGPEVTRPAPSPIGIPSHTLVPHDVLNCCGDGGYQPESG